MTDSDISSGNDAPPAIAASERIALDGKFFRVGQERFIARGVTYGTFAPNKAGDPFPEPPDTRRDFGLVRNLGANTLRVYDLPPPWFLDAAAEAGIRLFVTLPWACQSCFLDSRSSRREIRTSVTSAVRSLAGHPAVFAVSLAHEIPPDIVRWSGPDRIAAFIDELADAARETDPDCLCTYANYPPTEFLRPRRLDFVTFNVFLHDRPALDRYLSHLQLQAGDRPLVLGECGADALRDGPDRQAAIAGMNVAAAFDGGLAGAFLFSFTDDWVRAGKRVQDWNMGLTDATRMPRPAFETVRALFHGPAYPRLRPCPRVSVVVASYNGAETLEECIDSILELDYPDFEVLVIDDGSTDRTPDITVAYSQVRTLRHRVNLGLSAARNLGIRAATGEIVAFTDSDCRVDRHWLRYLVAALCRPGTDGAGGPNLLPPDDSPLAAAVMASPGGPWHVMLDEQTAEHVPGCNMAFWKTTLSKVGEFDPVFQRAGDDVDLCWRIQRLGGRLGFAPAAFVWHHRRATVEDYLAQQAGYGHAEALLVAKHPEKFNALGHARWRGTICSDNSPAPDWRRPAIHHGPFGTGLFQTLYAQPAAGILPFFTSLEYHACVAIPVLVASTLVPALRPLAFVSWAVPPALCALAGATASLPADRARWWSRPLIAGLYYLQPLVRGGARLAARIDTGDMGSGAPNSTEPRDDSTRHVRGGDGERAYWSETWRERTEWIARIVSALERHHWPHHVDTGWNRHDLAIFGSRWAWLECVTAAEANADRSQTLRARFRSRWTASSHLLFWASAAMQLLALAALALPPRHAWFVLPAQAALALVLESPGRSLRRRFAALLDRVARDEKLAPVDSPPRLATRNPNGG